MAKRGPKPKQFCIHNHDTFICGRTKSGSCRECCNEYQRDKNKVVTHIVQFCPKNHDTFIVGRSKNGRCKECSREDQRNRKDRRKIYLIQNEEKIKATWKIWYELNKDIILTKIKKYRKNHPEVGRRATSKIKIKRKSCIPNFGQEGIIEFYNNKPVGMTVDHIIPLCGDLVSGLHVIWNLQYLTPKQNSKKHNKCNLLEASELYGKILEREGLK